MNKKTTLAALTLFVAIVGTGIFALPYSVLRLPMGLVWLVLIGGISALLNWFYTQIIIATPENLQLAGFARKYFPWGGQILGAVTVLINLNGVLLAYLVAGGDFLAGLFPIFSSFGWGLVFYAGIFAITILGIKRIVSLNRFLAGALIILIAVFVIWGSQLFKVSNIKAGASDGFIRLIPVIFFSYAGFAVIPELEEVLPQNRRELKKAVLLGSILPIVLYFLFCLVVIGALGEEVSTDFVSGAKQLSPTIFTTGSLLGLVAVSSSCISFSFSLKEFWHRDMGLGEKISYCFAFTPALGLYLVGARELLPILSWTGGLSTLLITIIIAGSYWQLNKTGRRAGTRTRNL